MIFRRIKAHVAKEDWFAVFIDFIIVVFGVFMGFQVQAWNEGRTHVQTEQAYIERIRDDLTGNHDDLTQRFAYFTQVRAHALDALKALDDPPETLGEPFLIDVFQASHILPRMFGRDTYDEVLSVGGNNAISDVDVRKRLANFYRSIQAQLTMLERGTPYRTVIRRHMPYSATSAIRGACYDIVETGAEGRPIIRLPSTCAPGLTDAEIKRAVAAIRAQNIRPDLTERMDDLDAKLVGLRLMMNRVDLLDAYLQDVQE